MKEWQERQEGGPIPIDQNSINTGFRRGSMNEVDDDEVFGLQDAVSDTNSSHLGQERVIKLSQVLEGSLYIELQKECQHCENSLREEELFSLFMQDQSDYTIKCPYCQQCFVPKFLVQSEYKT